MAVNRHVHRAQSEKGVVTEAITLPGKPLRPAETAAEREGNLERTVEQEDSKYHLQPQVQLQQWRLEFVTLISLF